MPKVKENLSLVALLLLLLAPSAADSPPATEIHFIHSYKIVTTFVDLEPVRLALHKLKATAHHCILQHEKLKTTRNSGGGRGEGGKRGSNNLTSFSDFDFGIYRNTLSQSSLLMHEIDTISELGRDRRSLPFLGEFIHTLAGNPTKKMHENLAKKVNLLLKEEAISSHISAKLTDQVTYLAHASQDTNMQLGNLTLTFDKFGKNINTLYNNEILLLNGLEFESLSRKITAIAENAIRKANSIHADGKNGFLNIHALSPPSLKKILYDITIKSDVASPLFKNSPSRFYDHKLARTSWVGKKLHISLKIPLLDHSDKHILEPISPSQKKKSLTDISFFLARAVNAQTGTFSYLTETDLQKCNILEEKHFLCQQRKIEIRSDKVLAYFIAPETLLTDLSAAHSKKLELRCSALTSTKTLETHKVINLKNDCTLKHELFFVGKNNFETSGNFSVRLQNLTFSYVPKHEKDLRGELNVTQHLLLKINQTHKNLGMVENNLGKISGMLKEQSKQFEREKKKLIVAGGAITTTIAAVIIIIIIALCCLAKITKAMI